MEVYVPGSVKTLMLPLGESSLGCVYGHTEMTVVLTGRFFTLFSSLVSYLLYLLLLPCP